MLAKLRTKKIEDHEKIKKAEQDQLVTDEHRQAIDRIEKESRAEKERFDRELAEAQMKSSSVVKDMIGAILEDFHAKYFRKEAREERHKHRATLFFCVESEGNSGREKKLVIFARAGPHKDSTCSWPIDDNHLEKCRGVAGQIWFHGVGRAKTAACDWPSDGNPIEKARYAESMGLTVDEAEALNVKSKVLTGAEIIVRGQKWGVLLLDSLKEGHITDGTYEKQLVDQCAALISSVLGRTLP